MVEARDQGPSHVYVRRVELDGRPLDRLWLTHSESADGGHLEFFMGPEPARTGP